MKLTEKVKDLKNEPQGNNDIKKVIPNDNDQKVGGRNIMTEKTHPDFNKFLSALNNSIDNLNSAIYTFSVATVKIDEDKKEMERLAREVARQKVDVGMVMKELQMAMKAFPTVASKSIQSSLGTTSGHLNEVANGLISEVKQSISNIFKEETKYIKHAANYAYKSAESMKKSKEFVGWQFFTANLAAVMIVVSIVTAFVLPNRTNTLSSEDKKYIKYGKALEAAWPKLTEKARQEISTVPSTQ